MIIPIKTRQQRYFCQLLRMFRGTNCLPVNSEQILTWIPFSVTTIENSSALNTSVEVAMTKQIITRQTAVILLAKECLWSDTLKG